MIGRVLKTPWNKQTAGNSINVYRPCIHQHIVHLHISNHCHFSYWLKIWTHGLFTYWITSLNLSIFSSFKALSILVFFHGICVLSNIQSLFLDSILERPSPDNSGLSQKEFSSWKSYKTLSLCWVLLPLGHFTGIKCPGAFVSIRISLFLYYSFISFELASFLLQSLQNLNVQAI